MNHDKNLLSRSTGAQRRKEAVKTRFTSPARYRNGKIRRFNMADGRSREFDVTLQIGLSICVSSTRYRRSDRETERIWSARNARGGSNDVRGSFSSDRRAVREKTSRGFCGTHTLVQRSHSLCRVYRLLLVSARKQIYVLSVALQRRRVDFDFVLQLSESFTEYTGCFTYDVNRNILVTLADIKKCLRTKWFDSDQ